MKTMPATHGAGSPNQQLYSLFPKKKKSSKKNDQLEDGVSLCLDKAKFYVDFQEKRSSFSQRRIEGGMADKVSDWRAAPRPDPGPPQIREGEKTVPKSEAKNLQAWEGGSKSSTGRAMSSAGVQVNRESRGTRPSMSFAEMAKRGGGGRDIKEKSSRNVSKGEVETSERGSRQTGPCLSQVPAVSSKFTQETLNEFHLSPGGAESDLCLHIWQDWQISRRVKVCDGWERPGGRGQANLDE